MNSNLFHNLANAAALLVAVITGILVSTGCIEGPDGSLSCEASSLSPTITVWAIAILMVLKLLVNVVRDGVTGLTKPQPPVPRD